MQGLARKLPVDGTWLVDAVGGSVWSRAGAGGQAGVGQLGAVFASVGHATGGEFGASCVVVCEAEREGVVGGERHERGGCV
jgi:hypothetical protein